ncbi:hypothetical protein NT6N_09150 [Oceaniferula spumae]|uniref:Ice-binding protein C-terminal domain-containing protein n=1 Tax=Oceaniferula spumae TaxID=2979115 RepID=A0AAT9FIN9_9BACT
MKKILYTAGTCLLATGLAQSATFAITNWDGNGSDTTFSGFAVSAAVADGNDLIYTWTRSGNLDGMGPANDTLSFDLRHEAFTGSSYSSPNVTLGNSHDLGGVSLQHFGPGGDLDNNQSFRLSIENIVFTQGEALGWEATFDGFSDINRFGGSGTADYYFGTTGAETVVGGGNFTGPVQVLTVTSTTANSRFRNLDFAITTAEAIPEPSSAALVGLGGLALILRRRRS